MTWADRIDGRLDEVRRAGRWRSFRPFDADGPRGHLIDPATGIGRDVVTFASNDYLGLTVHPVVRAAARDAIDRWGAGTGGSRYITGSRPVHHDLEAALASWKGTERAVVFPTGFATNLGVLTTLGDAGTRIVSVARNHASIIDGARLARAEVTVWDHDEADAWSTLDRVLASSDRPTIVVADTVFSMDGDVLDLAEIGRRCRSHGALLVLDEAHAVLGPDPQPGDLDGLEVVRIGTLSKTLGSLGGFAACSARVADLLVNAARPNIFTTALSPADAAAALAALAVLRSDEGDELAARLRRHIDAVAPGHPSPIVPIVVGDEAAAVDAAARLLDLGLHVPAIRPPTVAPGTSRLRVTLSAAHTDDEVGRLVDALASLGLLDRATTHRPDGPDRQSGASR